MIHRKKADGQRRGAFIASVKKKEGKRNVPRCVTDSIAAAGLSTSPGLIPKLIGRAYYLAEIETVTR